jgi:hypothetical protein
MSRPRFLSDHDLNEHIVDGVLRREPAVEFARARDFHLQTVDDAELLEFAASQHWIVVSHDVNTMAAAATSRIDSKLPVAGLIMVHQDDSVGAIIENLVLIWSASEMEEWMNQVVFLPL